MGAVVEYESAGYVKVKACGRESVSRKNDSVRITFCRAGQRVPKEDLRGPRENTGIEHAVALTTLALFFGYAALIAIFKR